MAYRSSSDSSKFSEQDDRAYNALMHEVQQKFLWHREHTSARLHKIEDMLELAVHKLSLIGQVQQESSAEEGFINPSKCPKMEKQHSECKSTADNQESLLHPNLRFPKFKEGSVALETVVGIGNKTEEWLNPTEEGNVDRKELEAYQESPRYDEEPGESHQCWLEQAYTQAKACTDHVEVVTRMNQPSSSAGSSVSNRNEDSLKFGKLANIQCTAQASKAGEVIKLSHKQLEDRLKGGFCPYCNDKEGPSHEYIQPCQFVMTQEEEMSSLENSEQSLEEKSKITSAISENQVVDSVPHFDLRPPKFEGAGVFDSLQECEYHLYAEPIYNDDPVYDADPMELQECWPEHELISAALRGNNLHSSSLLQSDFCTSERLEVDLRNKPDKVLEDGDKPKLIDYRGKEKQGAVVEESSIILTSIRELIENVPGSDSPPAPNYSGLEEKSSHLDTQNMVIFNSGGRVQKDHSKGVDMLFKDMIRTKKVKLQEVALSNSTCGQPGQWQEVVCLKILAIRQLFKEHPELRKKSFVAQIANPAGIQGRDIQKVNDEIDQVVTEIEVNEQYCHSVRAGIMVFSYRYTEQIQGPGQLMRLEASRKNVTIYIYDPGGDSSCLHGVLFGVSAGISNIQQLLQIIFNEKELYLKEKANIAEIYLIQVAGRVKVGAEDHEDMVHLKGGGMLGLH